MVHGAPSLSAVPLPHLSLSEALVFSVVPHRYCCCHGFAGEVEAVCGAEVAAWCGYEGWLNGAPTARPRSLQLLRVR